MARRDRWDRPSRGRAPTDPKTAGLVALVILVVGALAVVGVIVLTRDEGKSSSPLDGAVPLTTAPPSTTSATASGQLATLTASSYADAITISTCQRVGKRGVVLLGIDPAGSSVVISAPDGTGSLAVTGVGATPGALVLSGRVTSANVGADGQFDLAGNLDPSPAGPAGPFAVTGLCS